MRPAPERRVGIRACRGQSIRLDCVTSNVTLPKVIISFRHRGLERYFLTGEKAGIRPEQAVRVRLVLGRLAAATSPTDMDLPGVRLHPRKGKLKGRWSVTISGNWRITFGFEGKNAVLVDYEDYH